MDLIRANKIFKEMVPNKNDRTRLTKIVKQVGLVYTGEGAIHAFHRLVTKWDKSLVNSITYGSEHKAVMEGG